MESQSQPRQHDKESPLGSPDAGSPASTDLAEDTEEGTKALDDEDKPKTREEIITESVMTAMGTMKTSTTGDKPWEMKLLRNITDLSYRVQQHNQAFYQADPAGLSTQMDVVSVTEWHNTADNIFLFVRMISHRPGVWETLTVEERAELCSWTPRAEEILGDPRHAVYLYTARIWHTLDEQVFSAKAETRSQWHDAHWNKFAEMRDLWKCESLFSTPARSKCENPEVS